MNNKLNTTLLQSPMIKKRRKSIILQAMDAQQQELLGKSITEVLHSFLTATMAIIACQSCFVAMIDDNHQQHQLRQQKDNNKDEHVKFHAWLLRSQSQEFMEEIEIKTDPLHASTSTHGENEQNNDSNSSADHLNDMTVTCTFVGSNHPHSTHQYSQEAKKVLLENLMSNTSLFHCNTDPDWLHAVFNGNPIQNWSLVQLNAQNHHVGGAVFINRSSQHSGYLNKNEWDIIAGCLGSLLYHHGCKRNGYTSTRQITSAPQLPHVRVGTARSPPPQAPQIRRLQGLSPSSQVGSPQGEAKVAIVERKLTEALQSAQKAIEERNLLLKNMSHELKTPLNCIIGMQNMLLYTPLNAEQRDYVNLIGRSANVLLTLINDVLDYSQTDKWKSYDIVEFDLRRCVEEVFEICTLKGQAKNLEMVTLFDTNIPDNIYILGDVVRISHILFNLICNAIKFTSSGTVMLKTIFDHFDTINDAQYIFIRFEVHDTGIGIDEVNFAKIGTPFLQLNPHTAEGTGLGLAICKSLIAEMKGSLNLASTVGKGSVFSVVLPFQTVANPSANLTQTSLTLAKYRSELYNKNICVIDSQAVSRSSLKQLLEQCGCRVSEQSVLTPLSNDEKQNLHAVFIDDSTITSIEKLHEFVDSLDSSVRVIITATHVAIGKYTAVCTFPTITKPYKLKMVLQKLINTNNIASININDEQQRPQQHLLKGNELHLEESRATTNQSILIVDDNVVNLKVLSHMLTKLKLHHDVAHHGQEAVEMASKTAYSLIFMDIMMPIMDGYDASKAIRLLNGPNGSGTIVALTTKAMTAQDLQRCKEVGMNTVLAKPISFAQLSGFLRPLLNSGAIRNSSSADQSSASRRFSAPL